MGVSQGNADDEQAHPKQDEEGFVHGVRFQSLPVCRSKLPRVRSAIRLASSVFSHAASCASVQVSSEPGPRVSSVVIALHQSHRSQRNEQQSHRRRHA
jgi:hypothetical protein